MKALFGIMLIVIGALLVAHGMILDERKEQVVLEEVRHALAAFRVGMCNDGRVFKHLTLAEYELAR
jgi:hypothetical protein